MAAADSTRPVLDFLLGDDAIEILQAAAHSDGYEVESATPSQVRYSPGRSVTVQYRCRVIEASGESSKPMLVATSGVKVPDGTKVVEGGDMRLAVWRFPDDPLLPGLASATHHERAAELLTRLGAPSDDVTLRTRAYRATRRAVVEARGQAGTIFMKVLRPKRVAALQARHVALAPHVPIPHSLGWSEQSGILAMQALPGRTLRNALEREQLELPSPQALLALLDQFPTPSSGAQLVTPPHARAPSHARLLGALLPDEAERIDGIVREVATVAEGEPTTAVHGDFHSSQILIDGGHIVGLVDVDTAGAGERLWDLANVVGQLSTVASIASNPAPFDAYITALVDEFERHIDPTALRTETAAVVFGLATGPFRVQLNDWPAATRLRLRLAEAWLDAAGGAEIPTNP